MHTGRIAHPDNTPHGRQPVAPSAVRPAGTMFTASGPREMLQPRTLNDRDPQTFYGGGEQGYTDYPTHVAA